MAKIGQSNLYSKLSIEQKIMLSVCSVEGREFISPNDLLREKFDKDILIAHCERHRLLPIFYNNIRKIDEIDLTQFSPVLKQKVLAQTQHALTLAMEGVRVSEVLNYNGIRSVVLKGSFLSQQLYSNPGLRPSKDIDILVHESNIDSTNEILLSEGYKRIYPAFELTPRQKRYYQTHKNQYAYRNVKTGALLELHWRIFSSKPLFNVTSEILFDNAITLNFGGKSVNVLSPEHNFTFLCLHGSIHQWFRLLWLRDITQLLSLDDNYLDIALRQSKNDGTERVILQALTLSKLFFNYPELPIVKQPKVVQDITQQACSAIIEDESKTLTKKISRLRIPFYKMKLRKELKYKLSCWTILHPNFSDWNTVKLNDRFFFLYFLLRPFTWFVKVYRKKETSWNDSQNEEQ